ncbi:MAG: hypothetical protein WDZ69_00780 [Candidatus Pacearchaeota archaeon]
MESIKKETLGYTLILLGLILLITLTFVKINYDSQSEFLCEMYHENPDLEISQCPAHNSNIPWLIFVAFGISFLVLFSGIFMARKPKERIIIKKVKQRKKKPDLSKLDKKERDVIKAIESENGTIFQAELMEKIGIGKVGITRILDKLEAKQIIERKRRGMNNVVVLKD